jgi:predicted esterase
MSVKALVFVLALIAIAATAHAQTSAPKPDTAALRKQFAELSAAAAKGDNAVQKKLESVGEQLKEACFERGWFWGELDFALPYRLLKPEGIEPGKKYPLLVALHGVGERGIDNERQIGNLPWRWALGPVQEKYGPFYMLLPQCPANAEQFTFAGPRKPELPPGSTVFNARSKDWQKITINVGQFARGQRKYLTLSARENESAKKYDYCIRNVVVNQKAVDLSAAKWTAYNGGEVKAPEVQPDKSLRFEGTGAMSQKTEIAVTLDDKSTIELEFKTDAVGRTHAVGLDTDDKVDDLKWITLGPRGWDVYDAPAEPAAPMKLLMALIDRQLKDLPVDPDRVYVTGLSMGGFGAGDLIQRRPDQFAAALIVCGGSDAKTAARIKHMPLWYFHGGSDPIVPTRHSREMVAALTSAGGKPKFTELPGKGHIIWGEVYAMPETSEWLFAQRRKPQ